MKANGQFKIESGVPIPPSSAQRTGASDALRQLKVGESVVIPASSNSCGAIIRQVITSKRFPTKAVFTSRKIDGDHTRVWRIK